MAEPPLANVITLGVRDFARALHFYQSFGWPQVVDSAGFAVFELRGALVALFGLAELGRDARATPDAGNGGIRSSLIVMVDRPEEVDELAERARQAGATITKEPVDAEFFEGRDCYFADPDGHFWEVAWSPVDNQVVAAARRAAGMTS